MYQRRVCRVSIPVVAIAVAAGCGGEDYGEDRFENVYQVQLVDGDDAVASYYAGQWSGSMSFESAEDGDDPRRIDFRFEDEAGNQVDVPLGSDGVWVDIEIDDDSIVRVDNHVDYFEIRALEPGETTIYFDFIDSAESFFDTRAAGMPVLVQEAEPPPELEVEEFHLLDRGPVPDEAIAVADGDSWDGVSSIELSVYDGDPDGEDYETAPVGEGHAVSFGAQVTANTDGETESVALDGDPYQLEAITTYTIGGDDDDPQVVWISDSHGDHVDIVGVEPGQAGVRLGIAHTGAGEIVYQTPELEVHVEN